jgi:hypothetical protein
MLDGDFESLLEKVRLNAGKKIPDFIDRGISTLLKDSGWEYARRSVFELSRRDSCPSNIYGFLENKIHDYKNQEREGTLSRDQWRTYQDNCASATEWSLFFNITNEILIWHRIGLVKINHDGVSVPMSTDEFRGAGYPKTWSSILDHFLSQYCANDNKTQKEREDFLGGYLNMLVT